MNSTISIDTIVLTALPFMLAYLIQALRPGMKALAENMVTPLLPKGVHVEGFPRQFAVMLALHFYDQVSFLFSLLLSAVSALVIAVHASVGLLAILDTFLTIVAIGVWFTRWQTLAGETETREKRAREMTLASLIVTSLLFGLTVASRVV